MQTSGSIPDRNHRRTRRLTSKYDRPMNAIPSEEEPALLHCALELRVDGDYCRGLVRANDDGCVLFDEYVSTRGLIASLRGNTQEPVMTCSCTVPECAGFYNQESRLSEHFVHWSLRYNGEDLDLLFDRNSYENAALSVLRHFRDHPWDSCGFGTAPDEYDGFEDFVQVIDELLGDCPQLAEAWNHQT